MMTHHTHRAYWALQWVLLRRIGLTALLIAGVAAGAVYWVEQQQMHETAVELAVQRATEFVAEASATLADPDAVRNGAVQAQLERFAREHLPPTEGGTVAVTLYDADTDAHNYRVTIYSVRLAEAIGLDADTIRALIKGAFLHDVGKIGIQDHIQLKLGRLTPEEFEEMKTHVGHGLDIVGRAPWLADATAVVDDHHEKVAGTGYPDGLARDAIPLTARIFAIADDFDALTSQRPYKEPLAYDEAMNILQQGRDYHFDARLLDVFMTIAPALHAQFVNTGDERAHEALMQITDRYFRQDPDMLLG